MRCEFANPGQCVVIYRHQRCTDSACPCPVGGHRSMTTPRTMTVRVADRRHSPVGHATIRTITILAECPTCGGPRGEPYNHNFNDDGDWLSCDRWDNACGHTDNYDRVLAEAGL